MPLIDLNKSSTQPLVIPQEIARDAEVASAISAHVAAADPHPGYLTQTEGDGRYRQMNAGILLDVSAPAICRSSGSLGVSGTAGNRGLEVQSDSPNAAYMTFHIGTQFACRFGLDAADNELKIGGWSYGANAYRLWHANHGTPVFQTPSDRRLKNSVKPIKSALEVLLSAMPVGFRYTAEIRKRGLFGDLQDRCKRHYGFMAQDFPITDLVVEKDGDMGIDYVEIIPFLVRAIQEQQEQIDGLKLKLQEK